MVTLRSTIVHMDQPSLFDGSLSPTLACIDMAGTTVRDEGIVLEAFAAAMAAVGLEGAKLDEAMQYAHKTMGLPKFVVFTDILAQELVVDKQVVDRAIAAFDDAILDVIKHGGVTEVDGARSVLENLRAAGITVALTTGFSPTVQEAIIDQLGWADVADMAIAPGAHLRGRPYPDMVLHAALQAQVDDVRQVVVVGDTANDLWSGHRAGASVVAGVLTGSHTRAELEQAPCTHILASIRELPAIVGA